MHAQELIYEVYLSFSCDFRSYGCVHNAASTGTNPFFKFE